MSDKPSQQNRPKVQYRVELQKKIEINKSYSERRNQAIAMRILSYGLFGQKRYQNLYLSCSLNCFYYGLKIANAIHRRVPGLAMIIRFEQAHVIEYYSEPFEGKTYGQKKYSKINIKLTKTPTEQDKQQPGYNAGLSAQNIEQPLTDVIAKRQRPEGDRRRGRFPRRYNRDGQRPFRGGYRRPYTGYRDERQDRGPRRDIRQPRERGQNKQRQPTDYRQFRSNRYDEEQNLRGQRRTRGGYQRSFNNDRNQRPNYDDDRTFDRRRRYPEREDRGPRGPQRRKYDGESDQ